MRAYELTLMPTSGKGKHFFYSGGPGSPNLISNGIESGVNGLNIEFSLPFYTDQGGANIPAVITINNPDLQFFFKNISATKGKLGTALNGYSILLKAGWKYSALLEKSQTVPSYDLIDNSMAFGVIYSGVVSAFLPNYADPTTPSISIACMPSNSTQTITERVLAIQGAINKTELTTFIYSFINKGYKVKFDNSISLFNSGKQCIVIRAKGLNEAIEKLANIGIYATLTPLGGIILAYKKTQNKANLTTQKALASINNGAPTMDSLSLSVAPKTIQATQIIGIPQIQDAVTTSIVIALNYRFRLGDKVYLSESEIYKFALQNNEYSSIISAIEVGGVSAGLFSVIGVEHVGSFRSNEATKWATRLLLVRA
ncbi:hypothetical protein HpBT060_14750 [Helicobacter pylori]